ncbi:MAG TPA: ABC transporter ATP-binding protein [Labilithrix sp.]|nr:ABC transporter ATP-binding protein [Labilithrix sp.]
MGTAIELRNAGKRYGNTVVVRDVSFSIEEGETFVLIGPSGCGKSTTMKMINRLVESTDGDVLVNGKDVRGVDVAELRLGIGYVIQDVGLFAHYTIERNVGLVPELLRWPEARRKQRVEELLDIVGLPLGQFGARYPRQLSGGQRQRAGIARALAADPPVVLLDEPFSALDPITRERLQDEFISLSERLGKTFVIVTHDIFEAVRLADRIAVMREGRLIQCGSPKTIVHTPADEQVAALLGRHRMQLRLMTLSVGECDPEGETGTTEGIPSIDAASSAWEAIERMERAKTDRIRVEGRGVLARRRIFDVLGAT